MPAITENLILNGGELRALSLALRDAHLTEEELYYIEITHDPDLPRSYYEVTCTPPEASTEKPFSSRFLLTKP